MDYSQIKRNINLDELGYSDIFLLENFNSIKHLAYKLIDSRDFDGGLEFAKKLEIRLEDIKPDSRDEEYFKGILYYWVFRLKLFALINLSLIEKRELLKFHIVEILKYDIDVRKAILRYFEFNFFERRKDIEEEARNFLAGLKDGQEIIGSNTEYHSQNNFRPTVSSWLKEYQAVLQLLGEEKLEAGAFHIVKFMDTNPYVKYLSEEEKRILRNLLDLYNWLLSPVVYAEQAKSSERVIQTTQKVPYMVAQNGRLPEILTAKIEIEKEQPKPAPKLPPSVPMAPRRSQVVGNEDISNRQAAPLPSQPVRPAFTPSIQKPAVVMPPLTKPAGGQANAGGDLRKSSLTGVNIQDILNKRTYEESGDDELEIYDQSATGSQNRALGTLKAPLSKEPLKPQVDIDKKLEDLKKKIDHNAKR